jgi:hypothetical protein
LRLFMRQATIEQMDSPAVSGGHFFPFDALTQMVEQAQRGDRVVDVRRRGPFQARPAFGNERVLSWTLDSRARLVLFAAPVAAAGDWVGFWRFKSHVHSWIIPAAKVPRMRRVDPDEEALARAGRLTLLPQGDLIDSPSVALALPSFRLDPADGPGPSPSRFEREARMVETHLFEASCFELAGGKRRGAPPKSRPFSPLAPFYWIDEPVSSAIVLPRESWLIGPRAATLHAPLGSMLVFEQGHHPSGADWRFSAIPAFEFLFGWLASDPALFAHPRLAAYDGLDQIALDYCEPPLSPEPVDFIDPLPLPAPSEGLPEPAPSVWKFSRGSADAHRFNEPQ